MGRRRNQRISASLSVRLFGIDAEGKAFVRLAHLVDISAAGARVGGVYLALKTGDTLGLQYGKEERRYRVVWTGRMGSKNAGEIGLRALEPSTLVFGMELPHGGTDSYEPKSAWTERREHFRFDCDLGAEIRSRLDAPFTMVRCTDLSRGGCYLETWSPFPTGTTVYLVIKLPEGDFHATGEVRTTDPSFGMGIRFTNTEINPAIDSFIVNLIRHLNPTPPPDAVAEDSSRDRTASSSNERQTAGPRVLLAEDSRFLRSAYSLYLRRAGFQVITAEDGDQALKLAATETPDVVVLDLLMPRLGGIAALKVLKEDLLTTHIPVIILSGLPSSNEERLIECGAFAYLAKTQTGPEELPRHVKRALESIGRHIPLPESRDHLCSAG